MECLYQDSGQTPRLMQMLPAEGHPNGAYASYFVMVP